MTFCVSLFIGRIEPKLDFFINIIVQSYFTRVNIYYISLKTLNIYYLFVRLY